MGIGLKIKGLINLFYMDDSKLYAINDDKLERRLRTVKSFSDDICLEFGKDKYAKTPSKGESLLMGRIYNS